MSADVDLRAGAQAVAERIGQATQRAFIAETAARQRDPHRFGLSSLGGCRRKGAYALSRTPVSDIPPVKEGREANLGTWEHGGLLPRLVDELPGSATEVMVRLRVAGLNIRGSIDLDEPETVVDLKTVAAHKLHGIRRTMTPYYNNLIQVGGYGLARLQEGRPPKYVAWLYMDRASGEDEVVVEPFTNEMALMVIDRATELRVYSEDPDEAPRDERGPGLSFECDECPWLKRCWGPDAVPGRTGPQSVHTNPEIEKALADYDDAAQRATLAKKDKDWAAARLERVRYGVYGSYKYRRDRDGEILDQRAAAARLTALGVPVPKQAKRGNLRITLVKPAPEAPGINGGRRRPAGEEKP